MGDSSDDGHLYCTLGLLVLVAALNLPIGLAFFCWYSLVGWVAYGVLVGELLVAAFWFGFGPSGRCRCILSGSLTCLVSCLGLQSGILLSHHLGWTSSRTSHWFLVVASNTGQLSYLLAILTIPVLVTSYCLGTRRRLKALENDNDRKSLPRIVLRTFETFALGVIVVGAVSMAFGAGRFRQDIFPLPGGMLLLSAIIIALGMVAWPFIVFAQLCKQRRSWLLIPGALVIVVISTALAYSFQADGELTLHASLLGISVLATIGLAAEIWRWKGYLFTKDSQSTKVTAGLGQGVTLC